MVLLSFINPLSEEGQEIVKEKGDLESVFSSNDELIYIVTHDKRQNIDDDSLIPESYGDLAIKRIQWYIERKKIIKILIMMITAIYSMKKLLKLMLFLFI